MGKSKFRELLTVLVHATGCVTLFGCGGESASGTPQPENSAAGAGPMMHGSNAGSAEVPNSNSVGASAGAEHAGNAGGPGAGGSGGSDAAPSGSAGTAASIDFSHGSRLLIPQRQVTNVHLGPSGDFNDLTSLDNIDVTTATEFVDAPIYSRQFEVNFDMSGLFAPNCQIWTGGKFDVGSLEVKQDLSGLGGHLKIEQTDGHYLLSHDGPGTHQIRVTGTYRVNHSPDLGGVCFSLPMGAVEVPIAFTTNINIQRMGSVKAAAPYDCGPAAVMLSGRNYRGTRIDVLNEFGQPISGSNVYDTYPLDVLVETEKPAQIAEAGLGLNYDGLIVTGEPQAVRLSTSYGTLFTYQLANTAMIDGLDVQFWSRPTQYVKSPTYPTTMSAPPLVSAGKVVGASATLKVGGAALCSPILATDFATSLLSPNVCKVELENTPDPSPGIPGFLATFVDPAGTCELEVSVPGANGGKGLVTHFSSILVPAPAL